MGHLRERAKKCQFINIFDKVLTNYVRSRDNMETQIQEKVEMKKEPEELNDPYIDGMSDCFDLALNALETLRDSYDNVWDTYKQIAYLSPKNQEEVDKMRFAIAATSKAIEMINDAYFTKLDEIKVKSD